MTDLFRIKIERLTRELQELDLVILRSRNSLTYLFSEVYNPPPESPPVLAVTLEIKTMRVKVFTSPLEFYRIDEIYGVHDFVDVVPVTKPELGVELGRTIVTELKKEVQRLSEGKRIVGLDERAGIELSHDVELVVDISRVISRVRRTKIEAEIEWIKRAIDMTEKALQRMASEISKGMSETQIAGIFEREARELGAEGYAFPIIVAIGGSAAKPHYIPSPRIKFTGCEPILVDCGLRAGGYVADITRMLIPSTLGREYEEVPQVLDAVSRAVDEALKVLKAGVSGKEAHEATRRILAESGGLDKFFVHSLGHGLGIDVHEEPVLSVLRDEQVLENEVVTVEPGVYIRNRFGVRIEEDVLIKSGGAEILTRIPRVIEL